jgi:CubicO group peptidase (beta-lactamase class C family)
MMLGAWKQGDRGINKSQTIKEWTRRQDTSADGSTRGLGWDTRSRDKPSAGKLFSPLSFGHTGFTGTSVWGDFEHDLFAVLLTNRVHPTAANNKIAQFRPVFHDAVARACGIA